MGESVQLTAAIRMIWREAALAIVEAMREEVAETGSKGVEERANEVESFAIGLLPFFEDRAIREGAGWTDEKVLSAVRDSKPISLSLMQGMAGIFPSVRREFLSWSDSERDKPTILTREFIEEQEWRDKRNGLSVSREYRAFQAYELLLSIVAPVEHVEEPAVIDGAADRQEPDAFAEMLKGGEVLPSILKNKVEEVRDRLETTGRLPALRAIVEEYSEPLTKCRPNSKNLVTWLESMCKTRGIK